MNQGVFGFPNSNDSLSAASVNNQVGQTKVWSNLPGRPISTTDMGRGTSGYQTADGGFADCFYGPSNARTGAVNAGVVVANRIYFSVYHLAYPTRISGLHLGSGSTVTTGNMMFAIYNTDEFGLPTTALYTSPSIAVGAGSTINTIRNFSGLTPPLLNYYQFAAVFDNTPTMSVVGSGNAGYNGTGYGTRGPVTGVGSIGIQYDVGSFTLPQTIKKQDLVFVDYTSGGPHTMAIMYTAVGQRGI